MKIETKKLLNCLNLLGNAIATKSTDQPILQMVEFNVVDDTLKGYTFDKTNYLEVSIESNVQEDFSAIVNYIQFYNIIKSIKSDIVELSTDKKALKIKSATLKCKIPIQVNSEGNKISVVKPNMIDSTYNQINLSKISSYISNIKSIVDENFAVECYQNVYFGKDAMLITDTNNIIKIEESFFDTDILLAMSTLRLLSAINSYEPNMSYVINDNKLYIKTDTINLQVIGKNKTDFQYDDLNGLFDIQINGVTTISGNELVAAINSSTIFNNYDKIDLCFNEKGVSLNIIPIDFSYSISTNKCNISDNYMVTRDVLKRLILSKDDLSIYYGNKDFRFLKVQSNNIAGIFSIG